MDKCFICGKEISLEDLENNNIIYIKSKQGFVHNNGKCSRQLQKQYELFKDIWENAGRSHDQRQIDRGKDYE